MTRLEFNEKILKMFADVVTGWKCNFIINTIPSADGDEIFVCVGCQRGHGIVKKIAHSEGYRAQLNPDIYENKYLGTQNIKIPEVNIDGKLVKTSGYTAFDEEMEIMDDWMFDDLPEEMPMYLKFREIDKLRMVTRRLEHFVSIASLQRYGVIKSHFVAHVWATDESEGDEKHFVPGVESLTVLCCWIR